MFLFVFVPRSSADSLDTISCTDMQQQWGRLSAKALYEPRPVAAFCHVDKIQDKVIPQEIQDDMRKQLLEVAPDSALAKHKRRTRKPILAPHDANVARVMDSAFAPERVNPMLQKYTTFQFFESSNAGGESKVKLKKFSLDMLSPAEKAFYESNVCLSHEKARRICLSTVAQGCTLWHSERKKRITGSICRELFTFKENAKHTWAAKLERLYCKAKFRGNSATDYGKLNEPVALEEYELLRQTKVSRLGLVIAPEVPWLGYSPDGISSRDGRKVLIEVKCPVLGKDAGIVNLVEGKKLSYIVQDGQNYALKRQHSYYSQCKAWSLK
ncbi:uncharacterized protein LOC144154112 [Haemaphysalis longicornis]